MRYKSLFITFLLFNFLFSSTRGQDYLFGIEYLTTEDGLASTLTSTLTQDSKGYIWIGTSFGLNRYDGYQFQLFNKENNGLSTNAIIQSILEDDSGKLWLLLEEDGQTALYNIFDPQTAQALPLAQYFADQLPFPVQDIYRIGQILPRE